MEFLPRDANFRTVGGGASSMDDTEILAMRVDPSTDYMLVNILSDSIVATPASMNKRDQNYRPTMYGVSSVDGQTLIPIRTDENGAVLIDVIFT